MPDIKTRDVVRGTIKTLDRAAVAGEHMKESFVRTREKVEQNISSPESSPEEYASDRLTGGTEATAYEAAHLFDKQGRKAVHTTGDNIQKAKQHLEQKRAEMPKKLARDRASKRSMKTTKRAEKTIKTIDRSGRTIKQPARATGKAAIKTTGRSVKTAAQTGKTSIKTAEVSAKTAQRSAQAAVKTAQKAAQTARTTARATLATAKAAAKATISAVKAIIAGTKALIAAIAAGGWIAFMAILIICMIGLLVSSVFGIFFSGEDSGSGMTMQTVVREVNADYDDQLAEIRNSSTYDVLEMSGSRAVWKQVLAVYAVKVNTDPENPQEVATMDENKKQLLKDIFWEMNVISSRTETKTDTVITESDDGNGNIVETETTETRTTLYIVVTHKTVEEMSEQYSFNQEQKDYLAELLKDENNSLWSAALYGIRNGDGEIVSVALSQTGNVGGEPYWSWYGFESRVEWCACFVSWCANECGYIDAGIIPKYASCVNGVEWFRERGQWLDGSEEPLPGMIIFYDWDNKGSSGPQDGESDHTGIVERVEDSIVYTVEGNSGDSCRERSYRVGHYEILGYGVPAY